MEVNLLSAPHTAPLRRHVVLQEQFRFLQPFDIHPPNQIAHPSPSQKSLHLPSPLSLVDFEVHCKLELAGMYKP